VGPEALRDVGSHRAELSRHPHDGRPQLGGLSFSRRQCRGGLSRRLPPYLGGLSFGGGECRGGLSRRLLPYLDRLAVSIGENPLGQPARVRVPERLGLPLNGVISEFSRTGRGELGHLPGAGAEVPRSGPAVGRILGQNGLELTVTDGDRIV
jgi:hypothetical protein